MKLSQEDKELAREVFQLFDNRKGWIAVHEIGSALRGIGLNPTEADLTVLQTELDSSSGGRVGFEDFCRVIEQKRQDNFTEEQVTGYLQTFDHQEAGYIEVKELREVMTSMGERLTQDEMQSIIADFDARGEGRIKIKHLARRLLANDQ
jgi:Ca2+-binding EF-hand superfamily protein